MKASKVLNRDLCFDHKVNKITINSKLVEKDDVFIAIKGKKVDGNNYIEELNVDKNTLLSKMNTVLDRYSDVGKYLYDISIERHIIEQSFLTVGEEIPREPFGTILLRYIENIYKTS